MSHHVVKDNSPRTFRLVLAGILLLLGLAASYPYLTGHYWVDSQDVFLFEGLSGPESISVIESTQTTDWRIYDQGGKNRLAILLTDPDSAWLGLVHGLKTIGVPFRITRDVSSALQHQVVVVYPIISGKALVPNDLNKLADFARAGGTLIGVNVVGGGLNPLFGFKQVVPSNQHYKIDLPSKHPFINTLLETESQRILLSSPEPDKMPFIVNSYESPKHPPLGVYEDGTAAIIKNKFNSGEVYAFGFDIGFYLLKAYNQRFEGVADRYANSFEPSVDTLLRLLKGIYQRHQPDAITMGTVPFDHAMSVILSHDIDYSRSMINAVAYARHEQKNKLGGTHFVQTKYIKDWNDMVFFDDENLQYLRQLNSLGVEIGSHSVSHSKSFSKFPIGDGSESYPAYRPYVMEEQVTYNGTVLGDLRVSKFLIEHFTTDNPVVSFRPGHLSNPIALPQALLATGYRYSSSVTANVSLSHLPFKLNHNRDILTETEVFEFPITVEDELPPRMDKRLDEAIGIAHKISKYGGLFVVLIHPDILEHKLAFQKKFVDAVKDFAWFGTLAEFGQWWSARDKIEINVTAAKDQRLAAVNVPQSISGITLELPERWKLVAYQPSSLQVEQHNNRLLIDHAQGRLELQFAIQSE
jgi:hypothetical protein